MSNKQGFAEAILTYLEKTPALEISAGQIISMDELPGDHNSVWRIQSDKRDFALKMFMDAGQARGRRQFTNQESAAQIGMAPSPIAFDRYPEGLSHQVMLYEWSPGSQMNFGLNEDRMILASALAAVHSRQPMEQTRLSPHPVNQHYQWSLIQGSRRLVVEGVARGGANTLSDMVLMVLALAEDRILPVLDRNELTPPALVHGDLQAEHCLNKDGQVQLLDWEMGGLGDPAREICHLFTHLMPGMTPSERAEWIAVYRGSEYDTKLEERICTYEVLLPVASLLELVLLPATATGPAAAAEECQLLQMAFALCLDDVQHALEMNITQAEKQELSDSYLALRQDIFEQTVEKEVAP